MEAEQLADLFRVALGRNLNLDVHVEAVLVGAVALIALLFALFAVTTRRSVPPWLRRFEIDEAELGVGQHKVVLRPNTADLQIAHALIELSTRKIGLPIALDHDVISRSMIRGTGFRRDASISRVFQLIVSNARKPNRSSDSQ